MHDDDRPVGRFLTRRQLVGLFGAAASGSLLASRGAVQTPIHAQTIPDCVAQPQQTEGPYFVDERLQRSDIRVDTTTGAASEGSSLTLNFEVLKAGDDGVCAILPGAQVDIWHCDASGVYSDAQDRSVDTRGRNFLRGYQVADANGRVRFTTIYPGWYSGRAVHIHFKIRVPGAAGRTDEFTSQLYFNEELTDRVHAGDPYSSRKGQRLLNARDMIFRDGGAQLMLPVIEKSGQLEATFRIAMRPGEAAPGEFGPRGGRGRRPRLPGPGREL